VIFPGNVGDDHALAEVYEILSRPREPQIRVGAAATR
jgi:hypothetical protein